MLLAQREVVMADKERSFILPSVSDMRITYDSEVPPELGASLFTAGTDDAGHPYVLDMVLGWENVFGPAVSSRSS